VAEHTVIVRDGDELPEREPSYLRGKQLDGLQLTAGAGRALLHGLAEAGRWCCSPAWGRGWRRLAPLTRPGTPR
jgi:hypothetical protein